MTELKSHENNIAKFDLVVAAEDFEKAVNNVYKKNKSRYRVDGFRKGKVPKRIIEKMYGVEVFYDEAIQEVFPEPYNKAIDELNLEVIDQPSVDFDDIEKGKDVVFKVEVETKPHPTLGDYSELEVTEIPTEVTDEDVEHELKHQQEENARIIPIEDGEAQDGDTVNIDFDGFLDGERFEGGKAENHDLVLGSKSFVGDFEKQVEGHKVGDKFDVNVTFPEDYQAKEFQGKDARFEVEINSISRKELPEIDDEFAKDISEFETLEDYKADIKEKIRDRKKEAANTERENKIVDAAVEAATMDIPEAMIEEQVQQMTDEFAQRLSYQGLSMEQYLMFSGMDAQKFADDLKPQAVKRIETRLVLEAIAKAEDITASEEDFKAELEKMAGMYQMETEQLEKIIQGAQKDQMMDDIAVQKAVDFLVGEAK